MYEVVVIFFVIFYFLGLQVVENVADPKVKPLDSFANLDNQRNSKVLLPLAS